MRRRVEYGRTEVLVLRARNGQGEGIWSIFMVVVVVVDCYLQFVVMVTLNYSIVVGLLLVLVHQLMNILVH